MLVTSKSIFISLVLTILFIAVIFYLTSQNNHINHDNSDVNKHFIELEKTNSKRSLKISVANDLWINPKSKYISKERKDFQIKLTEASKHNPTKGDFIKIFDEYRHIGINNMITGIGKYHSSPDYSNYLFHQIGAYAINITSNYHHVMEVVSESTPSDAAIHGAVWQALLNLNTFDLDKLFNLIKNDICYMKDLDDVYENCIHGTGHGFGLLFGSDYNAATNLCKYYDTLKYQYECAGGTYMVMEQNKVDPVLECPNSLFPGGCFRAFYKYFKSNSTTLCNFKSDYVKRGCIWAEGTHNHFNDTCEKYYIPNGTDIQQKDYLVCLDGSLTLLINDKNKSEYCPLLKYPEREYPSEVEMICNDKIGQYHSERYSPYLLEWLEELAP